MKAFNLPDLGEGLQEARIIEWHVQPGEEVKVDQPLLSVETAKAIVEIPSPRAGRVGRLLGAPNDMVRTGAPLLLFDGDEGEEDARTVVGRIEAAAGPAPIAPALGRGDIGVAGRKALPAVRLLARQLGVDLADITASRPDGVITAEDVRRAASPGTAMPEGQALRGLRLGMARAVSQAHVEVAAATIMDDADMETWAEGQNITVRLLRALVAGCRAEPALNAWYEGHSMTRQLVDRIDIGIAIDIPDGLLVAVLRDAGTRDAASLQQGLDELHASAIQRTLKPEELRGQTITLSNFGMLGGRYAVPVVIPPAVAILAAGRVRRQVVPAGGMPETHRLLPLSLSFDHRAVTGGEAARFLNAVIADLELVS
jgi:pyruvate dehydrogenase E2 component (dihydrolipoamide acetyltransferase)